VELSVDISPICPRKTLRIIPYNQFHGAFNMAVDFFLAQSIDRDDDPILRFYGWDPYCLSLGRHQDQLLVDAAKLKKDEIELVRRPTGGSAILHAAELTYSLIVPLGQEQHHAIYNQMHLLIAAALQKLGYDAQLHDNEMHDNYLKQKKKSFACFNRPAMTEIKFKDKKLAGSAQKLYRSSLLQHGSILIDGSQERVVNYLQLDASEKTYLKEKVQNTSVTLQAIRPDIIHPEQLATEITEQFDQHGVQSIYYQQLTESEKRAAIVRSAEFSLVTV